MNIPICHIHLFHCRKTPSLQQIYRYAPEGLLSVGLNNAYKQVILLVTAMQKFIESSGPIIYNHVAHHNKSWPQHQSQGPHIILVLEMIL